MGLSEASHNGDIFDNVPARRIDMPTAPRIREIHALWELKRGAAAMPKRADMGASVLNKLMPFVYIIDVLEGGADFSMRFMGTAIVQSVGCDYTGIKMSESKGEQTEWRERIYRLVYQSARPVFTRVPLTDFDRSHVMTECALLPLANKDGEFTMILCCATPL